VQLFLIAGIEVIKKNNCFVEANSGLDIVIIQDKQLGFDSTPTNIKGKAIKLLELGWKPNISIESILDELV
jgi:hypothetical protein